MHFFACFQFVYNKPLCLTNSLSLSAPHLAPSTHRLFSSIPPPPPFFALLHQTVQHFQPWSPFGMLKAFLNTPPSSSSSKNKKKETSHRRTHSDGSSLYSALSTHYDVINQLGKGSVGTVFQATDRYNRRLHAVKVVRKSNMSDPLSQLSIRRELAALKTLHHKNILHLHHVHEDKHFLYIATEYCSQGDLVAQLRRTSVAFSEFRAVSIMRQVFSALKYMHARGVSHRDVKLANILLAPDGTVRLADFGLVHWREDGDHHTSARMCGTAEFASPEVLQGRTYSPRCADIWACGVTLYTLLSRSCPFEPAQLVSSDRAGLVTIVRNALQHDDLPRLSVPCRKLLLGLLQPNAERRLTAAAACALCDDFLDSSSSSGSSSTFWNNFYLASSYLFVIFDVSFSYKSFSIFPPRMCTYS